MTRVALPGLILLIAHMAPASAAETEFRIGPRIGPGEIRIDEGQIIGDEVVDPGVAEDSAGIGGTFEYRAPFGVVLEVGILSAGSTDWWDSEDYRFSEYFTSVGYQVELGRGFSLIPRVGRARWKMEADEVWFFDIDSEDPPTIRGYQNYWEITALKRINPSFALGVSHKENNYEFGRVRSTVFTAMFNL